MENLCRATFRELVIPALLALVCPLVVALLGPDTLGGMLIGSSDYWYSALIVCGQHFRQWAELYAS